MTRMVLADTFAESRHILKSDDYQPLVIADHYRRLGEHLNADFTPVIRFLELLPVFLNGPRHSAVRRQMAINLAEARKRQEAAARQVIDTLPALLTAGKSLDMFNKFVIPLWQAMLATTPLRGDEDGELALALLDLFDTRRRIRERMAINERIRAFIDLEPESVEPRLIVLAQNALGGAPLTGALTMSLHQVFTTNLGIPLQDIDFPQRFSVSALPMTDRVLKAPTDAADAQEPVITRCVLHSKNFTPVENDEAMYGIGEHACLGRPLANLVWAMVVEKLGSLPVSILSSALTLSKAAPESADDYLSMGDLLLHPTSLQVTIGH